MAGLVAAARATELGARVRILDPAGEPGGSMRLSSGVVWRYHDLAAFRRECPRGDPRLQQLVVERLDAALQWLQSLGARVVASQTANPLTAGMRFDVHSLTRALAADAGELELGMLLEALPTGAPVVLATGGFQGGRGLVRRFVTEEADRLWLRANRWSAGTGLRLGLGAGAALSVGMDEFYGRNLPAPPARVTPQQFVSLAQLYARHAVVTAEDGRRYPLETVSWHGTEVVQWTARQPGARAWYTVGAGSLTARVGERSVDEMVVAARRSGARVETTAGRTSVLVAPGITTTLGGLRVNEHAQVLGGSGRPLPGLYAAGADAGGFSAGGYSSGLAAALVMGRIAAEHALGS